MTLAESDFGTLNPKAPPELSRFAFLIGRWRCDARVLLPNGTTQTFRADWIGRYILDGYVIGDEYRMFDAAGETIVLGLNFRSYDAARGAWHVKWLDALSGSWTDLVSQELGGISFEGRSLRYIFREPMAGHAYTRATYTSVDDSHFTWRGERSEDAKTWTEFMVVEALRGDR